jgi:hypothetical protein
LESNFASVIPIGEGSFSVASYVTGDDWNWAKINSLLPASVTDTIHHIRPPVPEHSDFPYWIPATDGQFSIKTAYELLMGEHHDQNSLPLFEAVWNWKGPARMRTTLWKMAHGKLLTNMERCHRGMSSNDLCPRCDLAPESLMHIIRDCDVVNLFGTASLGRNLGVNSSA